MVNVQFEKPNFIQTSTQQDLPVLHSQRLEVTGMHMNIIIINILL